MNPLAIIGSVAGVAGVAAITFLGQQMFFGFVGMVEARTESRIEKALMVQAEEYRQTTQAKADEEEKNDTTQRAIWETERSALEEKNNDLFKDAEQRIRADADAFDDDVFRTIAGIMCKAKNIGDNRARSACLVRAAKADLAEGGAVLAITPKRIEDWRIKCELTGEDIYCDYAVPAITSEGMMDLVNWMNDADAAMLIYDSNHDIFVRQIHELKNVPAPSVRD